MTPAKIYPFSIPAGGSFPLLVIGDYCKILTCSGALSLTGDSFGTLGPILAGQGVEQTPFNRLVLSDNTGAVNNGTILIADNKFIDDRITGEVSVIDGAKSRTKSNIAFFGSGYAPPVVGNYSYFQLWNPVGSTKNIVVNQVLTSWFTGAIVPTYQTLAISNAQVTSPNTFGTSKLSGGANSVMQVRFGSEISNAVFLSKLFDIYSKDVMSSFSYKMTEPIIVTPGYGLSVIGAAANSSFFTTIEYNEELIL